MLAHLYDVWAHSTQRNRHWLQHIDAIQHLEQFGVMETLDQVFTQPSQFSKFDVYACPEPYNQDRGNVRTSISLASSVPASALAS